MIAPNSIYTGDVLAGLKEIPDKEVHCCITSPPYWNLRDYGVPGQLGLEKTPEEYITKMVSVFREVKRVLRDDGTLWLNIGDSYNGVGTKNGQTDNSPKQKTSGGALTQRGVNVLGCKPKDLIGIPWMLAFALRANGWYLRSDIIWSKPNCMPESVTDRPTKSHEYIFLLSKNGSKSLCWQAQDSLEWTWKKPDLKETMTNGRLRWEGHDYFYDRHAIKTPARESTIQRVSQDTANQIGSVRVPGKTNGNMKAVIGGQANIRNDRWDQMSHEEQMSMGANKRSVWTVSPAQFKDAHFATFPQELIVDCIKAGCPVDGVILDPFFGSGTSGIVSRKLNRNYIGIELNPKYVKIAQKRLLQELGMFN